MATISKSRRLINPGKKKRKLSALQKLFFGSKRQRAAVKNSSRRKSKAQLKTYHRKRRALATKMDRADRKFALGNSGRRRHRAKRISNVGEIITLSLPGVNPGSKRRKKSNNMAKSRRRRAARRRRSTANPGVRRVRRYRRRHSVANPVRRRRHVRRYHAKRRRRSNPGVRVVYRSKKRSRRGNRGRRRNPSGLNGGTVTTVLGVLGGAALTRFIVGKLPTSLTTGIPGYITTAIVGYGQGKIVGKIFKKQALGRSMVMGGMVMLGLKVIGDFFPSLAAYIPFSLSGLGLIGSSSFYTPQVPRNGSIASGMFTVPSAVMSAIPPPQSGGLHGLGSRLNVRRGGRYA